VRTARIISTVNARRRFRISEARLALPSTPARSVYRKPFCSIWNLIASTGSGGRIGQCASSYAATRVPSTSSSSCAGVPGVPQRLNPRECHRVVGLGVDGLDRHLALYKVRHDLAPRHTRLAASLAAV
jgi:hypothetical protein